MTERRNPPIVQNAALGLWRCVPANGTADYGL